MSSFSCDYTLPNTLPSARELQKYLIYLSPLLETKYYLIFLCRSLIQKYSLHHHRSCLSPSHWSVVAAVTRLSPLPPKIICSALRLLLSSSSSIKKKKYLCTDFSASSPSISIDFAVPSTSTEANCVLSAILTQRDTAELGLQSQAMADFQTSSHRVKWIFTPEQLVEKHKTTNQRAKQMLEKYGTTRMEVDVDGSISYPEPQLKTGDSADKHSRPKSLSVEEEQFMHVYYEFKLREVCSAFYFPHKIQATALIFFKRFYLQWSVMELDPKHIMLTCIYAACKIEENHVSAEELGKGISQDHQMILNYEMIVLQSLDFDLIVYAPYRSVEGFINDMEEFCHATDDQIQLLKDLQVTAVAEIDKIMFTDAPLLFPPGQLALGALRSANEMLHVLDFERYLRDILSRQNLVHTISNLTESLDAIDSWVKKYKFPTEKDMKHINRKLKSCWGHSSHDDKKREKKSKHKSHKSSNEMKNVPSA